MKKYIPIIIGMVLVFASCSPKEKELQAGRTVISGVVNNLSENPAVLLVNFCDPLSDEQRFAQDLIASSGSFHAVHDYVFAQNLTIRYQNTYVNLYVAPGDSVFLTIDASKFQQHPTDAVTFSGDNAQINEQLFRWTEYAYHLPIPEFNPAAAPEEYLQSIKQCFNAMRDTIEAYSQRNEMNDFAKQWALIDYKFLVANQLLDYQDKATKWRVFTDSVFDIYNEKNFQTMLFPYHLSACAGALVGENEAIDEQLKQKEYPAIQSVMNELKGKMPEGTVRDMVFYLFIHRIIDEKPEVYNTVPELQSFFSQPIFNERLKTLAQEKSVASKPIPVTGETTKGVYYLDNDSVTPLPDMEMLPYLAERYKNKVIYVDVWATWCGPCLIEMKYMPTLHEYFAEKEVVFVNLCLESSVEKWLQTLNKQDIKGENYYLDENTSKLFMGRCNVSGFPTYLLIDKVGQLRSSVARPSNTQSIIEQIESGLAD